MPIDGGDRQAGQHPEQRNGRRQRRRDQSHSKREERAHEHAECAADCRERGGFEQKLPKNILLARADRFANADFARALRDGDEHDIHHADSADEQADRADREHHHENSRRDLLPQIDERIRRKYFEIIGLVRRQPPQPPQHLTRFVHDHRHVLRVAGFNEKNVIVKFGMKLLHRRERHDEDAVFRIFPAAQRLLLQARPLQSP